MSEERQAGAPSLGDPTAAGQVAFVSRSTPLPGALDLPILDADGAPLPGLRDASVRLVLFAVVCLQALSWWILEGYQLADSIEYMERAQGFVRGMEIVDSTTIRSFGFSAILAPLFWLADLVGVEDFKPIVSIVRCLQMVLGLLLIRICMRLGARLGGRSAGLAAGWFVGVNPVFLQYTISPVSGVAAALFVGHALECLIERGHARRALRGGLWLGLAMIMAYQTIVVVGPIIVLVFLRDRFKRKRYFGAVVLGVAIGLLVQCLLDLLIYGQFGISLYTHFMANAGSAMANLLFPLYERFGWEWAKEWAHWWYDQGAAALGATEKAPDEVNTTNANAAMTQGRLWYLMNLSTMFVWPAVACAVIGLALSVKRATWKTSIMLCVLLANFAALTYKGSKDFRLWLPLLPMIGPLCAWGWVIFRGGQGDKSPVLWRVVVAWAVLISSLTMGVDTLLARNTRKFMGYWEAMDIVAEEAAEQRGEGDPKIAVGSAYHWAAYLRESEDIELVKLPKHLDHWADYSPEDRQADLDAIAELDFFITHLAVLSNHKDLMQAVNEQFSVHSLLWDFELFENIGAALVLEKRSGDPRERRFFEVIDDADPVAYSREHLLSDPTQFMRRFGDGHVEEITLLGYDYEEIPGDGHGWITYHWYCGSQVRANYTIVDRITTADESNAWQNNHGPAYGTHPTNEWKPGQIIRESWPVVAAVEPYNWQERYRPLGGPYRRGDLMPARLWIDIATYGTDEAGNVIVTGRMEPRRRDEDLPMRSGDEKGVLETRDGVRFSKDDLVRVGGFFLPVHESARVPDDGRRISN